MGVSLLSFEPWPSLEETLPVILGNTDIVQTARYCRYHVAEPGHLSRHKGTETLESPPFKNA